MLGPGGKAVSAATVRVGLGWLEVPFVATQVKGALLVLTDKPYLPNPGLSTLNQVKCMLSLMDTRYLPNPEFSTPNRAKRIADSHAQTLLPKP